jgi:hypothetical protein
LLIFKEKLRLEHQEKKVKIQIEAKERQLKFLTTEFSKQPKDSPRSKPPKDSPRGILKKSQRAPSGEPPLLFMTEPDDVHRSVPLAIDSDLDIHAYVPEFSTILYEAQDDNALPDLNYSHIPMKPPLTNRKRNQLNYKTLELSDPSSPKYLKFVHPKNRVPGKRRENLPYIEAYGDNLSTLKKGTKNPASTRAQSTERHRSPLSDADGDSIRSSLKYRHVNGNPRTPSSGSDRTRLPSISQNRDENPPSIRIMNVEKTYERGPVRGRFLKKGKVIERLN